MHLGSNDPGAHTKSVVVSMRLKVVGAHRGSFSDPTLLHENSVAGGRYSGASVIGLARILATVEENTRSVWARVVAGPLVLAGLVLTACVVSSTWANVGGRFSLGVVGLLVKTVL